MKDTKKIKIDSIASIQLFLKIVNTFNSDIDLVSDRYVIDAKSIIGVHTLDLSKPVEVRILANDQNELERFNEEMIQFEVE